MNTVYFNQDQCLIKYETDPHGKFHGMLFCWNDRNQDFEFDSIAQHNEIVKAIEDENKENKQDEHHNVN